MGKRKFRITLLMLSLLMLLFNSTVLYVMAGSTDDQQKTLTNYVKTKVGEKTYAVEGGGKVKGSTLFKSSGAAGYDLDEDAFAKLKGSSQQDLVNDIATYSNEAVEDSSVDVDNTTVKNWWSQLQQKDKVGTKFLNVALAGANPDFVTANAIFAPLARVFGVVLALGSILVIALLGPSAVLELLFITMPAFRGNYQDNEHKRQWVGIHAIAAVKKEEEDPDKTNALWYWFKKRVISILLVIICLIYIVGGALYPLFGSIIDAFSGFTSIFM